MRLACLLPSLWVVSILLVAQGCGGDRSPDLADAPDAPPSSQTSNEQARNDARRADADAASRRLSSSSRNASDEADEVIALLDGRTQLHWDDLMPILVEAAGADALGELILDRQLERHLQRADLNVSQADLDRERELLLGQIADDPDNATRLLEQVRNQRNLGDTRFRLLLKRNAALRKLVQDRVQVTDAMVEQVYAQRFGPRTVARLIMVETIQEASQVQRRLLDAGESFVDLAVELSIDSSGRQGGLLPEISQDDPSYPTAVRNAVEGLEVGQITDPVALDGGFALLRIERQIPPDESVAFEQMADELRREVRVRNERAAMQQRARTLLEEADVSVLDDRLNRTWQRHRQEILEQQ